MQRYDIDGQQEIVATVDELGTAGYLDHCPGWAEQATGPVTLTLDLDSRHPHIAVLAPQPAPPGQEDTAEVVETWDRDRLGVDPRHYWSALYSQATGGTLPSAADVLESAGDELSWDSLVGEQTPREWADCSDEDTLREAAEAYATWCMDEMDIPPMGREDVVETLLDHLAGAVDRDDVSGMAPDAYVRLWDRVNG